MKVAIWLAVVLTPFMCDQSFAQTACPGGVAPGSPQCGPSPSNHGGGRPQQSRPVPDGEWIKTWGAIAMDSTTADVGTAAGQFSREEAVAKAVERCSRHGAKQCEVGFTYYNQCAAMAWPSAAGQARMVSSATPERAKQLALNKCRNQGLECRIIYEECAEPIYRKF